MGDRIITSDTGGLLRRSVFLGAEHHAQRHGTTALTAAREHVGAALTAGCRSRSVEGRRWARIELG